MTPEDRLQFDEMKRTLEAIKRLEDVAFIENIKRRIDDTIDEKIAAVELNDLADVDTSGVTNGQVIKYNNSNQTWENAADIDT